MKASELLKQIQDLIENHGDLEVLRHFDSYCYEECTGVHFSKANEKNDSEHFVI